MNDRYTGKVVNIIDKYTIAANVGTQNNITLGMEFLIVGIGEEIFDPDTKESLGQLEKIRGRAKIIHVQDKLSTLKSIEYTKNPDTKQITKEIRKPYPALATVASLLGGESETITESIISKPPVLKELSGVKIGDKIIFIK